MMRRLIVCLALLLPMQAAFAQDVVQILADRLQGDGQGIGIVAAVIENNTPIFTSFGVTQAGGQTPVNQATLFEIGSISKLFVNLLLAQMVLDGTVKLDDPAANYLPQGTKLPEFKGQKITLRHLATHRAGLPSIPPTLGMINPLDPYEGFGAEPFYAFLAAFPLLEAPGTRFQYSNMSTTLLAEAISHTAGNPYAELVTERILMPLGMTETALVPVDPSRFASGHDQSGQTVPHWTFDIFAPAGAYISSAADLVRFATAVSNQRGTSLDKAFALMLEELQPADTPNMQIGLGWMVLDHPSGTTIWHNGKTGGFNSFIGFDRDSGKAAVVLANAVTTTGIEDIGFHLIDPNAPLAPQPKPRQEVTINPAILSNYIGTYELGPEFSIAVTAEDGQLFVQASGQDRFPAFAESDTKFFLKIVDAQISFELGPDGKVERLVLHQNGQDIEGRKQ
jgi:CubicO group peptidase (beta-lactamase class C family)